MELAAIGPFAIRAWTDEVQDHLVAVVHRGLADPAVTECRVGRQEEGGCSSLLIHLGDHLGSPTGEERVGSLLDGGIAQVWLANMVEATMLWLLFNPDGGSQAYLMELFVSLWAKWPHLEPQFWAFAKAVEDGSAARNMQKSGPTLPVINISGRDGCCLGDLDYVEAGREIVGASSRVVEARLESMQNDLIRFQIRVEPSGELSAPYRVRFGQKGPDLGTRCPYLDYGETYVAARAWLRESRRPAHVGRTFDMVTDVDVAGGDGLPATIVRYSVVPIDDDSCLLLSHVLDVPDTPDDILAYCAYVVESVFGAMAFASAHSPFSGELKDFDSRILDGWKRSRAGLRGSSMTETAPEGGRRRAEWGAVPPSGDIRSGRPRVSRRQSTKVWYSEAYSRMVALRRQGMTMANVFDQVRKEYPDGPTSRSTLYRVWRNGRNDPT